MQHKLMRVSLLTFLAAPFFSAAIQVRDCPLCVAEDNCHMACADIKHENPGGPYCLQACNGAHPDDEFGQAWFANADKNMEEDKQRHAEIERLGQELQAELKTN
eukprot:gnl/MRDRNA2_/MRDRNA2_105476_c0_seq1.p1 gnl/MRDRNA2_/MRDRNA2_105476_c0~~gnl/MRDRNA2_/MRDRNA2_105476_c0_seq1.p1  ORF type:complete len:104 (-),score=28.33 gnl/MRDRNA2_/MRDRNA2_105476_c0_seq1:89-400(-)